MEAVGGEEVSLKAAAAGGGQRRKLQGGSMAEACESAGGASQNREPLSIALEPGGMGEETVNQTRQPTFFQRRRVPKNVQEGGMREGARREAVSE